MQLDIVVAFFLLGAVASLIKAPIKMPEALYQSLTLFLLIAIGLKGGVALAEHASVDLILQSLAVVLFGAFLPFIAFPLLRFFGGLNKVDSAAIAAHYGSVSVATFAVALAVIESSGIEYEAYFPLFVVLLEVPAIAVGLWLARDPERKISRAKVAHEIFFNQGVLVLVGALLIGWWAGSATSKIMPLFGDLFHGVLALFLLEMGRVAMARLGSLKEYGSFITAFGVFMPLIGAALGGALAALLGFSAGGAILLATLGASASYIAVPAAMAVALPQANHSLSITASLAVTFPFNVLVGIPIYLGVVTKIY